jgi:hypothetical protein
MTRLIEITAQRRKAILSALDALRVKKKNTAVRASAKETEFFATLQAKKQYESMERCIETIETMLIESRSVPPDYFINKDQYSKLVYDLCKYGD